MQLFTIMMTTRGVGQGHAGHAMACPVVGTPKLLGHQRRKKKKDEIKNKKVKKKEKEEGDREKKLKIRKKNWQKKSKKDRMTDRLTDVNRIKNITRPTPISCVRDLQA